VGEEAQRPLRMVPRSMVIAIGVGRVFYVACVAVQSMAFGSGAAFAASPAPLGELAGTYVGLVMEDALHVAALISALGAGLGCASVCARVLFALGRDGKLDARLAAIRFLPRGWERVLPAAGIAVAGYVLYHNLWPVPASPFDVFPYIAAAWLAAGIVVSRLL
jgi:hypothetical protein